MIQNQLVKKDATSVKVGSVVPLIVELKQTVIRTQAVQTATPAQRMTAVQQNARRKKVVMSTEPAADVNCVKGNEPVISFVIQKQIARTITSVASVNFVKKSFTVPKNAEVKMTVTTMVTFALTVIGVDAVTDAMPSAEQRETANIPLTALLAHFARMNFGAHTTVEKILTVTNTMLAPNVIAVNAKKNVKADVEQKMIAKPPSFVLAVISV